ncbi:hypothetical protein Tco_0528762 [Tanacetum coccineum]
MADNRTMAQLLQAPTEGYEDAIVIPEINANFELKHELHQLDTFYNALNANDQDSLNSAAGGNFLDKMPRECLRLSEKFKGHNSRNKAVRCANNFNQGQVYQPPTIQPPVYQAPPQQMQGVSKTNFENYVKANDAVLRNMQNQGQVNAITTRSGKTCEGPSTPLVPTPVVSTPLKEPEQNPETSMDKGKNQFQKYRIKSHLRGS